ncbi:MAG: acetyltransferase [Bacteroidota bacterium]
MKNIVIFGAYGHGSVVLDCIEKEGKYRIIGFLDSFKKRGLHLNGYTVLGSEFHLPYLIQKHNIHAGIIAIGDNWLRKLLVDRIAKIAPGFEYVHTVHPKAVIGKDVRIGKGSVVLPGAVVEANATVGTFCIVNTNASLGHHGRMGDYSSLAPKSCTGGHFILGKFSAICLGTSVIDNITISEHSVVGAGSLVVGNIGSYTVAYGAPAKKIRPRAAGEPYTGKGNTNAPVIPLVVKNG